MMERETKGGGGTPCEGALLIKRLLCSELYHYLARQNRILYSLLVSYTHNPKCTITNKKLIWGHIRGHTKI